MIFNDKKIEEKIDTKFQTYDETFKKLNTRISDLVIGVNQIKNSVKTNTNEKSNNNTVLLEKILDILLNKQSEEKEEKNILHIKEKDIPEVCKICMYKSDCAIPRTCTCTKPCEKSFEKCRYMARHCSFKCPRRLEEV